MERSNTHPYTQDELVQNHICNECGVERVVDDEDNICQTCYHKSCDEGECYCCYGDDEDEDDEDEDDEDDVDIVFKCSRCDVAIIRNSEEHDNCRSNEDGDVWWCMYCNRKEDDEDEEDEDGDVDSEGFDIIWCADCGEARVYDKHYCEKCENEDGEEEEE